MKKKKIILASSSKFRKNLLGTLNIDFTCISPDINESQYNNEEPADMVIRLAIEKAKKICSQESDSLVISSDACASCNDKILGKPLTREIAIEYLEFISNKTIVFHTSICVMDSNTMEYKIDIVKYTIKIKELNKNDIIKYVDTHEPYYSSAAFRYEVAKDFLIKEFNDKEDDISGLIGLPLKKLTSILKEYNAL